MGKPILKVTLGLISLIGLLLPSFSFANEELPNPLVLDQALAFAEAHPRTQLDTVVNQRYPQFKPVYLNCHKLAYSDASTEDSARGRLFSPLFSAKESVELDILQRFFDVILADMRFAHNNESMAGAYIKMDRTKSRQELDAASELQVAEKDAAYQIVRQRRFASENMQRITRSLLAQAINKPDDLPSDLAPPKTLPKIPKELPFLDELYLASLKTNTQLAKRIKALDKPEQQLAEMELRQHLLERLLIIQQLRIAAERADSETYWRDLRLDRSRTLYDMEVKADLGDSMSLQTRAHTLQKQIQYCQILAWAEINTLSGKPLLADGEEPKPTEEAQQ